MSTEDFADFLYGACLLDWDAERERMQRYAERFDAAEQVRIVGAGDGSHARRRRPAGARSTRAARTSPAASSSSRRSRTRPRARSRSPSSRPSTRARGGGDPAALRGRAASSTPSADAARRRSCSSLLDTDEGARRLGELGIGCNPGITRHMRNTLFDEKIDGTVHLALGDGIPRDRRHERERDPLGHRQGPAHRRPHRARRRGRAGERAVALGRDYRCAARARSPSR